MIGSVRPISALQSTRLASGVAGPSRVSRFGHSTSKRRFVSEDRFLILLSKSAPEFRVPRHFALSRTLTEATRRVLRHRCAPSAEPNGVRGVNRSQERAAVFDLRGCKSNQRLYYYCLVAVALSSCRAFLTKETR